MKVIKSNKIKAFLLILIIFQSIQFENVVFIASQISKEQSQESSVIENSNQDETDSNVDNSNQNGGIENDLENDENEGANNDQGVEQPEDSNDSPEILDNTTTPQNESNTELIAPLLPKEEMDIVKNLEPSKDLLKSTSALTANFDGSNLNTTPSFSYDGLDLEQNNRILKIAENFPSGSGKTKPQLLIKFNNALTIANAPGMVEDSQVIWKFDAKTLPKYLRGVVQSAVFTPNSQNDTSGTLKYTFTNGTRSVSMDLLLGLGQSYGFTALESDTTNNNPLEISTSYVQNDKEVELGKTNMQSLVIQKGTGVSLYFSNTNEIITSLPNQAGSFEIRPYAYIKDSIYLTNDVYVKSAKFKIKIPKEIMFGDISDINGFESVNVENVDTSSDPKYTIVAIEATGFYSNENYNFKVNYIVPFNAKNSNLVAFKNEDPINVVDINGNQISISKPLNQYVSKIFIRTGNTNSLTIDGYEEQNLSFANDLQNTTNFLGGFAVYNVNTAEVKNQKVQLDFSKATTSIGVEAFSVPSASRMKNITVVTTKGNTKTIASSTAQQFTKEDFGITEPTEFFKTVTWQWESAFPVGYIPNGTNSLTFNYVDTIPIKYFGQYLGGVGESYSVDGAIGDLKLPLTDKNASKSTNIINVTDATKMSFETSSNLNTSLDSGETYKANVKIDLDKHIYSQNSAMKVKGFKVFLSEKEFFSIDPNTIVVNWNGQKFTPSDGTLIYLETVDNQGNKVYLLQVNQAILGYSQATGQKYPPIAIDYNLKVQNYAPTTDINASELIQVIPASELITPVADGEVLKFHDKNKFNVTGTGNLNQLVGTAPKTDQLIISSQNDFAVVTALNLNGGSWQTYDYQTQSGIINLNPEGKSEYRLSVQNNTASSALGYTALIPIPKKGEKTDLTPSNPTEFDPSSDLQPSEFEWSASILEPIASNTKFKYNILYSTKYATDKDDSSFVPWNQIVDKSQIRMIKVDTSDEIASGDYDEIIFPLTLSEQTPDIEAGKINIYSARVFKKTSSVTGYVPSELVAMRLKTGVIAGNVFNDTNRDGIQNTDEFGRNGVSVIAFEAGTKNIVETTLTKKIDNIDGKYEFLGLDKNQKIDVTFVNPTSDDSLHYNYPVKGGSTPTPAVDNLSATTKEVIPSDADFRQINAALMTPIKLTLDPLGGKVSGGPSVYNLFPKDKLSIEPLAIKDGYTSIGWYTAPTGGSKITFPYTAKTTDQTIYARYSPNNYKVTYDVQGETTQEEVEFDQLLRKPSDPILPNFTFVSWNTKADGTGKTWNFTSDKMPAEDITLFAIFEINQYNAMFDINGGEGVAPATEAAPFERKIAEPTAPTRAGYTFTNWNMKKDGSGQTWNFATETMPNHDIILFAQWIPNKYQLSFELNGGEGTTPITQSIVFEQKASEPAAPVRSGYIFNGWNTKQNGTGITWNFDSTLMPSANVTLYAQWVENKYNAIFNINGGEGQAPAPQEVTFGQLITKPNNPIRTGYTFTGWNTAADGSGKTWDFPSDKMPVDHLILYAQWSINSYQLSFNLNGGNGQAPTSQQVKFENLAIAPVDPTITSGTFIGWNTKLDGSGTTWDFATTLMPAENVTLYAQWQPNERLLIFNVNGGDSTAPVTQKIVVGKYGIRPQNPTRLGYTFLEWNTKIDGSGVVWNFNKNPMPDEDLILYAQWKVNNYQLSFSINGGDSGTPANQSIPYQGYGTNPQSPIRLGYTVVSWNTKADGTGETWDFATTAMPANNVILYAQWQINTYKVTFDLNGGVGIVPVDQLVDYKALVNTPVGKFTKENYTFSGWTTNPDGSGRWDFTLDKMPAKDMILYAKWTPVISYITLIGQTKTLKWEKYFGSKIKDPDLEVLPGYLLEGWYIESIDKPILPTEKARESLFKSPLDALNQNIIVPNYYEGQKWDFAKDTVPPYNFTLKAKYVPKPFTVLFINASDETKIKVYSGELVPKPNDPVHKRHPSNPFKGWYTKAEGGRQWDFARDKMPNKLLMLYARYDKQTSLTQTGNVIWHENKIFPILLFILLIILISLKFSIRKVRR